MHEWTIVTVAYNSGSELRRYWGGNDLDGVRWIVVDNASKDSSAATAKDLGAEVVTLQSNRGFSAANNVALGYVSSDWVMFANPDVRVDVQDLPRLARVADANRALIAPQLLNPDGTNQPNARGLPFLADKFANRSIRVPGANLAEYVRPELRSPTYAAWVMGAALGGRTSLIRSIGGWCEDFFLYYEDHEIGLRAWQNGLAVVLDPRVRWVHGWRRETASMNWGAWKREVPAALRFYRKYPFLLSRKWFERSNVLSSLETALWREAVDASP